MLHIRWCIRYSIKCIRADLGINYCQGKKGIKLERAPVGSFLLEQFWLLKKCVQVKFNHKMFLFLWRMQVNVQFAWKVVWIVFTFCDVFVYYAFSSYQNRMSRSVKATFSDNIKLNIRWYSKNYYYRHDVSLITSNVPFTCMCMLVIVLIFFLV